MSFADNKQNILNESHVTLIILISQVCSRTFCDMVELTDKHFESTLKQAYFNGKQHPSSSTSNAKEMNGFFEETIFTSVSNDEGQGLFCVRSTSKGARLVERSQVENVADWLGTNTNQISKSEAAPAKEVPVPNGTIPLRKRSWAETKRIEFQNRSVAHFQDAENSFLYFLDLHSFLQTR